MLHHPALHLQRDQGGSFVEHSILEIYQQIGGGDDQDLALTLGA